MSRSLERSNQYRQAYEVVAGLGFAVEIHVVPMDECVGVSITAGGKHVCFVKCFGPYCCGEISLEGLGWLVEPAKDGFVGPSFSIAEVLNNIVADHISESVFAHP